MNREQERIFNEIMQPTMTETMYRSVSFNLDDVWNAIKTEILPKLVTMDYYAVPFIEEARDFNMNCVFIKSHRNCCSKLMKKGRTYVYSTKLPTIIVPQKSDAEAVTRGLTTYESLANGIPNDYIYETIHEGERLKEPKRLSVLINGIKKQWSYLNSAKKELTISKTAPGLKNAKRIYVINELIMAEGFKIKVTINTSRIKTWEFLGPIPLAFKLVKFKMNKHGALSDVDDNTLPRSTDTELYAWERPSKIKKKYKMEPAIDEAFHPSHTTISELYTGSNT